MQNNLLPEKNPLKPVLEKNGKRILFACVPADGHFSPLTSLATHLKEQGYDVRWYTQNLYEDKIKKLGIPYYPFVHVPQLNQLNFEEVLPERAKHTKQVDKFKFDLEHVFIRFGPKYFEDLKDIYEVFPYDLLIADIMFTGIPYVKEKLNIPVIAMGIVPIMETSKDLPPGRMGMTPNNSWFGRLKQEFLRFMGNKMIFSQLTRLNNELFLAHGVKTVPGNVMDIMYRKPSLVLQSGTPGFEYERSDMNPNIRYVGPLLSKQKTGAKPFQFSLEHIRYSKVLLATQGTVEKDVEKLLVPVLEAYKDSEYLVVATTGGSKTAELRQRFPQRNILIEDFIPFTEIMPAVDVYITNGGYGGVLLGITHKLPLVVAGVHEGKNEICARVGHFKLGVNLKTETPSAMQIRAAVTEVLNNPVYASNVYGLSHEFEMYDSDELCAMYVSDLLKQAKVEYKKINRTSPVQQ